MDRTETIADAFDRLFRTYERADRGSAEELARDRLEKASVYFEAVETYEAQDVLAAVRNFISGSAPGHNPSFIPPAPLVGSEVRRVMNLRLDASLRSRIGRPTLPPPDVVVSPEARARMADLAMRTAAALRSPDAAEEAAALERKKAGWAKTNARFAPDMSDAAIKRRLGYSAGDPEDDAHAA